MAWWQHWTHLSLWFVLQETERMASFFTRWWPCDFIKRRIFTLSTWPSPLCTEILGILIWGKFFIFLLLNYELGCRSSKCRDYAREWTIQGLNSGNDTRFCSPPKRTDRLWGPPNALFDGCSGISPGGLSGRSVMVPRLRMSAAIPLLLFYAFMAWMRATSLFYRLLCVKTYSY